MMNWSKKKAYKEIHKLMEYEVKGIPYKDTEECKAVGGCNIPYKIFKKKYPHYMEVNK